MLIFTIITLKELICCILLFLGIQLIYAIRISKKSGHSTTLYQGKSQQAAEKIVRDKIESGGEIITRDAKVNDEFGKGKEIETQDNYYTIIKKK